MESIYWWKMPQEHRIQRKKASPALIEAEADQIDEIYAPKPAPQQPANQLPNTVETKATFFGFLRAFFGPLLATTVIASLCTLVLVHFTADFAVLGAYIILYDGLLLTGIGVCVGLQIKWFRDYRAAGGQVFFAEPPPDG